MIIGIVSAKGGMGKTMVVVNLASALMEVGKKVCIIDGNKTTSNLGLHLGIEDYPVSMGDVLKGRSKMIDAVYVHPDHSLHVVPGTLSLADARMMKIKSLKKKMKELEKFYDFILLDTAPGFNDKAVEVIKSCDGVIMVTTPGLPEVTDSIKTINMLEKNKIKVAGIILNRVLEKDFEIKPEEIESLYKVPVILIIEEDLDIQRSISARIPIVMFKPNSSISEKFMKLAAAISGYKPKGRDFKKMKRLFKKKIV